MIKAVFIFYCKKSLQFIIFQLGKIFYINNILKTKIINVKKNYLLPII